MQKNSYTLFLCIQRSCSFPDGLSQAELSQSGSTYCLYWYQGSPEGRKHSQDSACYSFQSKKETERNKGGNRDVRICCISAL